MLMKYLEPLFAPFRSARSKMTEAQGIKGSLQLDVRQAQRLGQQGKDMAAGAQGKVQGAFGQAQAAGAQAQGVGAGAHQAMQQMGQGQPGAPGAPGGFPGGINPNPPIKLVGVIFKKKVCTQCNQQLDKSWDSCPYCAQAAQQAAAAMPKAPMKTQAFILDGAGGGGGMQLLGWIVPLQGVQRGELFALQPATTIGKDPSCTIFLADSYLSSRHADIRAEGGVWMLKDLGSTNGTYVNDKRIEKHELVDNDVVTFGKCAVKFKSL